MLDFSVSNLNKLLFPQVLFTFSTTNFLGITPHTSELQLCLTFLKNDLEHYCSIQY